MTQKDARVDFARSYFLVHKCWVSPMFELFGLLKYNKYRYYRMEFLLKAQKVKSIEVYLGYVAQLVFHNFRKMKESILIANTVIFNQYKSHQLC